MGYKVGNFQTPSLHELQNLLAKVECFPRDGTIKLGVEFGDVAAKQALSENRFATFQVASQFNCLEFPSQNVLPEAGITGYVHDRTQGPACAISCGPATAFRNYFVPLDKFGNIADDTSVHQTGQSRTLQINTLRDFGRAAGNDPGERYFRMVGGYTITDTQKLEDFTRDMGDDERRLRAAQSLRVGVHKNVQVTSHSWGRIAVREPSQLITQVFCSACPIAYNSMTRREHWELLGKMVLESAYEATLLVAILNAIDHNFEHGSNRVFLTCLGGGVFGNPTPWIVVAIEKALRMFKDYALDVRIVSYSNVEPEIDDLVKKMQNIHAATMCL